MSGDVGVKVAKPRGQQVAREGRHEQSRLGGPGAGVMALQDAVGNRAVSEVLGGGKESGVRAPPIVNEVLRSPGQPIDPLMRNRMESSFDHDFSQVRLHTDERASESAKAINAEAYTAKNHVVLASDVYSPGTHSEKQLLAHELTHVIQQTRGRQDQQRWGNRSFNSLETDAAKAAQQVDSSAQVNIALHGIAPCIQRKARKKTDASTVGGEILEAKLLWDALQPGKRRDIAAYYVKRFFTDFNETQASRTEFRFKQAYGMELRIAIQKCFGYDWSRDILNLLGSQEMLRTEARLLWYVLQRGQKNRSTAAFWIRRLIIEFDEMQATRTANYFKSVYGISLNKAVQIGLGEKWAQRLSEKLFDFKQELRTEVLFLGDALKPEVERGTVTFRLKRFVNDFDDLKATQIANYFKSLYGIELHEAVKKRLGEEWSQEIQEKLLGPQDRIRTLDELKLPSESDLLRSQISRTRKFAMELGITRTTRREIKVDRKYLPRLRTFKERKLPFITQKRSVYKGAAAGKLLFLHNPDSDEIRWIYAPDLSIGGQIINNNWIYRDRRGNITFRPRYPENPEAVEQDILIRTGKNRYDYRFSDNSLTKDTINNEIKRNKEVNSYIDSLLLSQSESLNSCMEKAFQNFLLDQKLAQVQMMSISLSASGNLGGRMPIGFHRRPISIAKGQRLSRKGSQVDPDVDSEVERAFKTLPEADPASGAIASSKSSVRSEVGVRVPASKTGKATEVLTVGGGRQPKENLGFPPERQLVAITSSDVKPPYDLRLNATEPIPKSLYRRYTTLLINNPYEYRPDIPELSKAVKPGGKIIVQGNWGGNKYFRRLKDIPLPSNVTRTIERNVPPLGKKFGYTLPDKPGAPVPNARITFEVTQ